MSKLSLSSDGQTLAILRNDDYFRVFSLVGDDWKQAGPDIVYEDNGKDVGLSGDGTTVIACGRGSVGNERGLARVYDYQITMGEYLDSASKAHQITADAGSVTFSQGERDGEIEFDVRVSKPVAGE